MAPHRGFGACLGIGVESTWGTAVSRTNWIRANSLGLRRVRAKERVPHLGHYGQTSTMDRDFFIASDFSEGAISFPVAYNDSSVLLLRHALGANAAPAGSDPYTHTLTLASPGSTGLTLEQISGTIGGAGNMTEVFEGALANTTRLMVEAGGLMSCEINYIAQTSGGLAAAGTPSLNTTREYIAHNHAGSLTHGGTAMVVRSLEVNLNRNLERNHELGSLNTSVPVEGGLDLEVEATVLWQAATAHSRYLDDTQGDLAVTFTGTSSRALVLTAHNALIIDRSAPVSSKGGILETIRFRCYADSSDQGLSLAFTNGNATHDVN
jgi:hypothetical protein